MLTFASILGIEEADLEDVFAPDLYARLLNQAFQLTGASEATGQRLLDADQSTIRLVKKAEAFFRVLPPETEQFDHYAPFAWLFLHPELLEGDSPEVTATLERAERVINAINQIPT